MSDAQRPNGTADLQTLPEIWEPETPGLRAVFQAIPAAVGAPGVHLLWRLLANVPGYLEAIWPGLAVQLRSTALAEGALRLRRDAFIAEAVGMPSHKAFRGDLIRAEIDAEFRARIERFNRDSQLALSRLLLAAALLLARLDGEPASGSEAARAAGEPDLPPAAPDAVYVPPLREGEARGKAAEVLDRVRREHVTPLLDDYYRSLARIPEYLSAAWNAIRPLVHDPEYAARAAELSGTASALACGLIGAGPPLAGERVSPEQAAPARAILHGFAEAILPQTLIDVTLIRALTSGPEQATA